MRHDYKFLSDKKVSSIRALRPRGHHLLLISAIAAGIIITTSLLPNQADANKQEKLSETIVKPELIEPDKTTRIIESLPLPTEPQANSLMRPLPNKVAQTKANWQTVKIKSGDNLAQIFARLKISATTLHKIINTNKKTRKLKHILPGQSIRFLIDDKGALQQLVYQYNIANSLVISKNGSSFSASITNKKLDTRLAHTSAKITHSLFLAAQSAGLSNSMTMQLANIFGWDIDFALDIRKDDNFTVIFEEIYMGDKKIRDGNILAAEFQNHGRTYRAIRYTDANGRSQYYSPKGMSMRKAFLRSPVDFSRISSRFNLKRKHPILNRIRAHKGVDYAARRGTPIRATGDGRILFKGRKGGYGRTIIIKHGSAYRTLYAHMRSYNKHSRNGSRVKQGQVIGYIGSSGLATGPHLHYEFRVNGAVRNPLTVRLPKAAHLPKKYRKDFEAHAQIFVSKLNIIKNNTLALLKQ
ncbi:MAG: peptidoglycan DD-metalloendopeptidase family protein [Gammaproteobacteria bacterium]|nr:peptidoglycan DD-metalloendopeptidase family protein [Gammaproteobacteria bacterium]